jgi:hypothetical protein
LWTNLIYDNGVTLAFNTRLLLLPTTYLTGSAAYNAVGTTPLQQIITQNWIANIINGYEAG